MPGILGAALIIIGDWLGFQFPVVVVVAAFCAVGYVLTDKGDDAL